MDEEDERSIDCSSQEEAKMADPFRSHVHCFDAVDFERLTVASPISPSVRYQSSLILDYSPICLAGIIN